jgi:hypothetical protein
MVKGARIYALIIMTLLSTVSPLVYQKAVEPLEKGLQCEISIIDLEMDTELSTNNQIIFTAYLEIRNDAPVPVVLPYLDLDVYEEKVRYELLGSFKTFYPYEIPAYGTIRTEKIAGEVVKTPQNLPNAVIANLTLGGPRITKNLNNTIKTLFEGESIILDLKGDAQQGPFNFKFQKRIEYSKPFFNNEFKIIDIFNFLPEADINKFPSSEANDTAANIFVVRTRVSNPSRIPYVLHNYKFNVYDEAENLVAEGYEFRNFVNVYDPDLRTVAGTRKNLIESYYDGQLHIEIPSRDTLNNERDLFLVFNFTDPLYPKLPDHENATTKNNINRFMNLLFQNDTIDRLYLKGFMDVTLGYFDEASKTTHGVRMQIGSLDSPPRRINASEKKYVAIRGTSRINFPLTVGKLVNRFEVGNMNITSIDVDRSSNEVVMNLDATMAFTNPYRLNFSINTLSTNYKRTNSSGGDEFNLGAGGLPPGIQKQIMPAYIPNINGTYNINNIVTNKTFIPHSISLSYDTDNNMEQNGIVKIFEDLGIDPLTLNFTNPIWLMGPDGMGNKTNIDPLVLVSNLIKNRIDPLMLLQEVNVSRVNYYGENAFRPLGASGYFGTNFDPQPGDRLEMTNDFPPGKYLGSYRFRTPKFVYTNWLQDYYEVRSTNQFEIVRRQIGNDWIWPGDSEYENYFGGFISKDLTADQLNGQPVSELPDRTQMLWRVYNDRDTEFWGYKYDNEDFLRNWYIIRTPSSGTVLFRQNVTLPIDLTDPNQVENALLGISYRYPNGDYVNGGRFGIGYWDVNQSKYVYVGEGTTPQYDLWGSNKLPGYQCYLPNVPIAERQDWQHRTVNVTNVVKTALQNYVNNGSSNKMWLQMEISFSSVLPVLTYMDDVDFAVEYWSETKRAFDIQDFFKKIEDNNPVNKSIPGVENQNNLFKFFDSINFDPMNLVKFIEADMGVYPNGDYQGADMINYYKTTDPMVSRIIDLLQDLDNLDKIDAGEPLNFLDMLNYSKYIIDQDPTNNIPQSNWSSDNGISWQNRTLERNNGWVIEDPYVGSRAFVDALGQDMFVDELGNRISGYPWNVFDKEMWYMFENLNVQFPWIIVYLLMHGWSKDDIFDLLEALGVMRESKQNFDWKINADSGGYLRELILISSELDIDEPLDWTVQLYNNVPQNFYIYFAEPIDVPHRYFYEYLNSKGGANSRRNLIGINGNLSTPVYSSLDSIPVPRRVIWDILVTIYFSGKESIELAVTEYEIKIYIDNNPGSKVVPTVTAPGFGNSPYLDAFDPGLNDLGSAMITRYLRQEIDFSTNLPFIEFAGDPLGLFQFLDDYVFLKTSYSDGGATKLFDYSSYTLLDFFDVSARDFVDIITGFDRFSNTHDPNGNGLADDWYAPTTYGFTNRAVLPIDAVSGSTLNGWGNHIKKNRLFYSSDANYHYLNGKIIWTDTPKFLDKNFWDQTKGLIDPTDASQRAGMGTDSSTGGSATGAPPIVSLFDMLAWLTRITQLDSGTLFDWIEGRLDNDRYIVPNPDMWGNVLPISTYDHGIGPINTWNMLHNCTFNMTGMFDWLSNVKGTNAYGLMYELNNWNPNDAQALRAHGTSNPDPMGLFYLMKNKNKIMRGDGSTSFIFHNSIGANDIQAQQNFWKLFNGLWWAEQGIVPGYFSSTDVGTTVRNVTKGSFIVSDVITTQDPIQFYFKGLKFASNPYTKILIIPADRLNEWSAAKQDNPSYAYYAGSFNVGNDLSEFINIDKPAVVIFWNTGELDDTVSYSYDLGDMNNNGIINTLPYIILNRLNISAIQQYNNGKRGAELTYNLFQFLLDLYVVPEDWINSIQARGILPFQVLAWYDALNIQNLLSVAGNQQKKTKVTISGNFYININGLDLNQEHSNNLMYYNVNPSDYTAKENLAYFFITDRFSTAQGTYYYHA